MTLLICRLWAAIPNAAQLPNSLTTDTQHSLRGLLPIILAISALIAGLILWAVYMRKSPKYRRKGVLIDTPPDPTTSSRRRRRQRQHRTRNPSRAEVGGLPPPGAGGSDPTLL